jgi:hypothetical protein
VTDGTPIWGRILRASLMLAIPVALTAVAIGIWSHEQHGIDGVFAVVLAALVCLSGGWLSLSMLGFFQNEARIQGVLAGTIFRTMFPFFLGSLLAQNGRLAAVGVFNYVLCFFLIVLTVETILAVRIINAAEPKAS